MNYLVKTGVFSLVGNYLRPSNNYRHASFNMNAVVLILIMCKDLRNWYNVYLNFSFFTVFLKNRKIISKIKRSNVTDYAALTSVQIQKQKYFKITLITDDSARRSTNSTRHNDMTCADSESFFSMGVQL